jgi:hypothetical protein
MNSSIAGAAADEDPPVLELLLSEANGVSGTAEWNDWKQRDPETAEWMGWYVSEVAKEARGDHDWSRAWNSAKEMVASQEERRRILDTDGP